MSQQPVTVRGVTLGAGIPKICVPLVGKSRGELLTQAKELRQLPADVAEWRCDWYEYSFDPVAVRETLRDLRVTLGDIPLLFTFRTAEEGGARSIRHTEYISLLSIAVQTGYVDLLDAELSQGEDVFNRICSAAHTAGVYVIASSHDFQKTPSRDEMLARLAQMEDWGADIAKLAVMPQSPADVLSLMEVTYARNAVSGIPLITMSMSGMGAVSRLSGEVFGSAMTFGSAGTASAPGQLDAVKLAELLNLLHGVQ